MNDLGVALVWCAVQVTLVAALALVLDAALRRRRPAAGGAVVLSSLLVILGLSAWALSPWPCWSWSRAEEPSAAEAMAASSEGDAAIEPGSDRVSEEPISATGGGWEGVAEGLTTYWQTFREEWRVGAEARPAESWAAVVAGTFLAGAGIGLAWLLAGLRSSGRYRRWSVPVADAGLHELVDVLRAELGCRAAVEVRQCDRLHTAATLGFFRALVLLPAEWTSWTAGQLRAVLAHELAHVRGRDFLGVLCARLGQVLHFYHPLVYWLATRLRLEQELAADAAAAAVAGGQRAYLRAIAELALAQADRPVPWPARTFLPTRTTLLRRIAMLRDTNIASLRPARRTGALAVAAVLACGIFAAGLRGPVSLPQAAAQESAPAADAKPSGGAAGQFDLQYVPENAVAFVGLRPAAMVRDSGVEKLGELFDESLWRNEGLPPAREIEQILYVWTRLPDESQPPTILGIIRTTGPQRFEATIRSMVPEAVEKQIDGQTYYYPGPRRARRNEACTRPDDRTLVCGNAAAMEDYQQGRRGRPRFLPAEAWSGFAGDSIAMALSAELPRRMMQVPAVARDAAPALAFAPLWEEAEWGLAGLKIGEETRLHGLLQCSDEAGMQQVAETLHAVKVLAMNLLRQGRSQVEPRPGTPHDAFQKASGPLLDAAEESLRTMTIEQQGNQVRFAATTKLEGAVLTSFLESVEQARRTAQRVMASNNLKQIALAMHNYHDTYKHFPPPVLHSKSGVPYSWRVALLPFLEQAALYDAYDFDQPWDSPANRRIAETVVPVFSSPTDSGSVNAAYYALVGPETIFDDEKGTTLVEIRDGTSNTILVVEAQRAIPWAKPEDIPYDAQKPLPKLGGFFEGGFNAALADGSVHFVPDTLKLEELRAMISKDGREAISAWERLREADRR